VRPWIVGRTIWAHIRSRRRDSDDILNTGLKSSEVESRFLGKLSWQIVRCNECSYNSILAEPISRNLNPVLLNHFDPGQPSELLGRWPVERAREREDPATWQNFAGVVEQFG